jgi:hypothetical protein
MSLWTPDGDVPVEPNRSTSSNPAPAERGAAGMVGGPDFDDLSPEEQAKAEQLVAEMAEMQRQLLGVPAAVIVVNHARGLLELAIMHLNQPEPRFEEARLAIDAFAAILDSTGERLGEDGEYLRQVLTQVQIAFVQRQSDAAGTNAAPDSGA